MSHNASRLLAAQRREFESVHDTPPTALWIGTRAVACNRNLVGDRVFVFSGPALPGFVRRLVALIPSAGWILRGAETQSASAVARV